MCACMCACVRMHGLGGGFFWMTVTRHFESCLTPAKITPAKSYGSDPGMLVYIYMCVCVCACSHTYVLFMVWQFIFMFGRL